MSGEACEDANGGLATDFASRSSKLVVVSLLFSVSFTSNVVISLLYPFAPVHLAGQGYGPGFVGMIFSIYSWAMLFSTPLSAALVVRFGRSKMLCLGILILSLFSAAFGYAEEISLGSRWIMSSIYVASRVFSGLGAALTNLSVFSMATDTCKDDLGKVMGANEVVIGLGFTVGPPIGSVLYVNFGFGPAFLIAAAAVMLSLPLALWEAVTRQRYQDMQLSDDLNETASEEGEDIGFSRVARVLTLRAVLGGVLTLCGTFVFGVMEPNLAQHLHDAAGLSQPAVGLVFAFFSAAYSLSGVPLGWVADSCGHFGVCTIGVLMSGAVMLLLGLPIWEQVSGATGVAIETVVMVKDVTLLGMLGCAQAALLVPTLPAIKGGVKYHDPATTEMVVTLFNSFQQLGLAIGPLAGAALVTVSSYETSLAVTGLCLTLVGVVCVWNIASARRTPHQFFEPDEDEIRQGFLNNGDCFSEVSPSSHSLTQPRSIGSTRRNSVTIARMSSLTRSPPMSIH